MSSAIPVRPLGTITGYASPGEAIRAAAQHPGQQKARDDSAALHGRQFVAARCDLRHWVIEFSGPIWLQVSADANGVDWKVLHEPTDAFPESEPVDFEWERAGIETKDHRALEAQRRGADFWQLWVNEMGLLLYLRKQPILGFYAVERRDTGEVLLSVSNSDW